MSELNKLLKQQDKLKQEEQQLKHQLAQLKARERKLVERDNLKRQTTIGRVLQKAIDVGEFDEQVLVQLLDKHLVKITERELFGLAIQGGA